LFEGVLGAGEKRLEVVKGMKNLVPEQIFVVE